MRPFYSILSAEHTRRKAARSHGVRALAPLTGSSKKSGARRAQHDPALISACRPGSCPTGVCAVDRQHTKQCTAAAGARMGLRRGGTSPASADAAPTQPARCARCMLRCCALHATLLRGAAHWCCGSGVPYPSSHTTPLAPHQTNNKQRGEHVAPRRQRAGGRAAAPARRLAGRPRRRRRRARRGRALAGGAAL